MKKTGFFLMVEGSQIDWAVGDTSTEGVITEMLDLDRADIFQKMMKFFGFKPEK